jgi:hypothetical protein
MAEEVDTCPVCDEAFKAGEVCAYDLDLGMCHDECLDGAPIVNLETGEPVPGGEVFKFRYGEAPPGAAAA